MSLDVARVRAAFPALDHGIAYFDGPGGSQVPRQVAEAVAATLTAGVSNRGTLSDAERRADDATTGARAAVADLLGADQGGVVFGRSATQLTYDLSRALAKDWAPGDEVVVTRLDHDANIRPWVQAAEAVGATVRWAEFDQATGDLDPAEVTRLLTDRTRLVAVTAASNLLGTRPDLPTIAEAAHAVDALVFVDGVHLVPHAVVDVPGLGADLFTCSPYKFFGPHLGVLVADPVLLARIHPDKLLPSTDDVPERFELGTLPYELLAGVSATVDFIAGLVPEQQTRRQQVVASMTVVEEHESRLFDRLAGGLRSMGRVTVHSHPRRHTPTVLFSVEGRQPRDVAEWLAARGVNAPAGSFYALEASRRIGLGDSGAVRAGLAPYTDDGDVDRLLAGVAEICA